MSCRIRAVEHRVSADGLAGAHTGLQDRILLNYTRIENAHRLRSSFFMNMAPAPELMVFICVAPAPEMWLMKNATTLFF